MGATKHVAISFWMGVLALSPVSAIAQSYPNKPIRIVAAEPAGGTDFVARILAPGLAGSMGQSVIVDNRATAVMGELVAKSPADGYTMLVAGMVLWLSPFMRDKTPYDPVKDFAPLSLVNRSPNVVVVEPSLPVKSIKDLIGYAKSKPGSLNHGSGGAGTAPHLAGELFQTMAGIKLVHIPYKGAGPALAALIAGELQLSFPNANSADPHVRSGRLRALAVTTAEPSVLVPGLPTVAAAGLPGYQSSAVFGIFAPGGTPRAIVDRLNAEIVRVLNRPEIKERFLNSGSEVVASSVDQLASTIKSDMTVLDKLIRDAGLRDN